MKWYELIPVFSFLFLRGKCRNCGAKLSMQYPMIELLNGILYLLVVAVKGFTIESVLYCICTSVLIVIAVIDWRTYEIPFGCNVILGILGMVRIVTDLSHWYEYVIGFAW